jgi:hypothetical protein
MASALCKRHADEAPSASTPAHKRVKSDATVNASVHSPAGLPAQRATHASQQVIWLKESPPSRDPIEPHPTAVKLFAEVTVSRFQPES